MNAFKLLKNCPFCGDHMNSFAGMSPESFARCLDQFSINCDCGCTGPFGNTMNEAVELWNRRHDETPSEFERCMK